MEEILYRSLRSRNPWLEAPATFSSYALEHRPVGFVPRAQPLELSRGRAELVVGPRQAGKTTWIHEELRRHEAKVMILHAEDALVRSLGTSAARLWDAIGGIVDDETVLYLEEAQHFSEAGLLVKGLVDIRRKGRLVVTGSGSFQLAARIRESLAGRVRRTRILPLGLHEVAAVGEGAATPMLRRRRQMHLWQRLLLHGGYPAVWTAAEPELELSRLVEAFALRDVTDLHRLERPDAFRRLLEIAAADTGNLLNLASCAALSGVSAPTARRYLELAESADLLRLVRPFAGGRRSEITGSPKVYLLDTGLRNAIFGGFHALPHRADAGALWETAVHAELLKRLPLTDDIRFWRTTNGAEVDFVVRRRDRLVAVEVKSGHQPRPTLPRAARSFVAAYRPATLFIINPTLDTTLDLAGVSVRFLSPLDLDEIDAALGGG